jgi:hypothetical protein
VWLVGKCKSLVRLRLIVGSFGTMGIIRLDVFTGRSVYWKPELHTQTPLTIISLSYDKAEINLERTCLPYALIQVP